MARFLDYWKIRKISTRITLSFLGFFLVIATIIATWLFSQVREVRLATLIDQCREIENNVLDMDRRLEKAKHLHGYFFLYQSKIGLNEAHVKYAQPAVRFISQAVAISSELKEKISQTGLKNFLQDRNIDLNLYLSSAKRFADTSIQSIELLTRKVAPEYGLELQFEKLANTLIHDTANAPKVKERLHEIMALYLQYRVSQQRHVMQSAFNVIYLLNQEIQTVEFQFPADSGNVVTGLSDLEQLGYKILETDKDINQIFSDFALQEQIVGTVSQALVESVQLEVSQVKEQIARSRQLTFLLIAVMIGLALVWGLFIVRAINRSITRRIIDLDKVAAQLRQGHLDFEAQDDSPDELGQLGKTFNMMVSRIRELVGNLEAKIAERTRQLSESERWFRHLFENSPLGIFRTDTSGKVLMVNRDGAAMLGCKSPDEALASYSNLATQVYVDPSKRLEEINELQSHGEIKHFECQWKKRNGEISWVSIHARLVSDEGVEKQSGLQLIDKFVLDISTRRKAEQDYQILFREMLNGFALHEIICDDDGRPIDYRFLAVNPAFERLTGLKAEQIVGRTVLEALPSTERYWIETYGKVALTGEPVYFENESRELGKHFAVAAFRFGPNQFACSFTDVSDRKHAERSLQERNEQLSNALRIARLGHWVLDIESGMFTFTDNFYEIFHATAEAVGGYRMSIADYSGRFVHPEDAELVTEEMQKAVESDDPNYTRYVEHRILFADGGVGHIAVKFFIIKNEDEKIAKIYGFNQDITERKQAEKERERLQEQLSHAQKIDSVGRLAGGVAHDFNNMLGVILGHTELAMEQIGPNEELYTSLEEIQRAAERSANLTRQLLAYARRQAVAPKVVDLNETVQGMLKMLRRLIGEDVDLAWLPGANLCPIYIDPSQIDQILANLCVNARDAISGTGTITIETDNAALDKAYSAENSGAIPIPGEYVLLAVSDDGCGLDTETRNRLFEPFFTTKAIGKGTGLGLATVYGIVKQNNGIINVYSEPGHGTTFKIYLPCNATKAAPESEQQQPSAQASGSETILLVEDEPAILKITTQILETIGYAVIAAGTPGEAIRLAREHKGQIDLLITDVVMPEMNGRDLARNLLTIYPDIKRLFMSGYTANIIAHHGVLDDGVHFIQKPFSKNDLAAKTEEALKG